MLVISSREEKLAVTMPETIQAVELALREFSLGKTLSPVRTGISIAKVDGNSLFMPSYVEAADSLGVKIVSVFPRNKSRGLSTINGVMALLDAETGEVLALMDASYLTVLRTGAVVGLAAKYLARRDASVLGVIGTGAQSRGIIRAIQAVRPLSSIYLYNRTISKAYELASELNELFGKKASIEVMQTPNDVVRDADMLVTATNSEEPVFTETKVKPGLTVSAIGAFTPYMQELPTSFILQAHKVVVESVEAALAEAGDLIIPMQQGKFQKEQIHGELGQIVAGVKNSRESDEELIIFKSVGMSVMDVVTARLIYDRCVSLGLGIRVEI